MPSKQDIDDPKIPKYTAFGNMDIVTVKVRAADSNLASKGVQLCFNGSGFRDLAAAEEYLKTLDEAIKFAINENERIHAT